LKHFHLDPSIVKDTVKVPTDSTLGMSQKLEAAKKLKENVEKILK
jgi:hypothetical protein